MGSRSLCGNTVFSLPNFLSIKFLTMPDCWGPGRYSEIRRVISSRLEGLSFFANYAIGYDAVDDTDKQELPDRREFNITVDYKPERLIIRGLWLRFRYANVDLSGDEDSVNDVRLILNYNLPLL